MVVRFNQLGSGVGGVLNNDRWGLWVWSMSLELFKKSWSLCDIFNNYVHAQNGTHCMQ